MEEAPMRPKCLEYEAWKPVTGVVYKEVEERSQREGTNIEQR
jgi:hypothetical protein